MTDRFESERPLSAREVETLCYLSTLMEATALMIGTHLWNAGFQDGWSGSRIGGSACGRLRRRGLVMRLPELKAWSITAAGREVLRRITEPLS